MPFEYDSTHEDGEISIINLCFFLICRVWWFRSLGAIPCESLSTEPCWANMNTLGGGGGGGGGGSSGGSSTSNSPGNNASGPATSSSSGGAAGGANGLQHVHGALMSSSSSSSSSSSTATAAAGTVKKRRKSDSKPLSQINKCLNEKRRREQVSTVSICNPFYFQFSFCRFLSMSG